MAAVLPLESGNHDRRRLEGGRFHRRKSLPLSLSKGILRGPPPSRCSVSDQIPEGLNTEAETSMVCASSPNLAIPRGRYFCAGFTGVGVVGWVFAGCDLIPSSTDFGPLCP